MKRKAAITIAGVIRALLPAALAAALALSGCGRTAALRLAGALSYARVYASEPALILDEFTSQLVCPFTLETAHAGKLARDIESGQIEGALVRDVPFYMQTRYGCGAAVLAGALACNGDPVELEEITRKVVDPAIGGTLCSLMITYPRELGFWSEEHSGAAAADLRPHLAAGRPVICLLGPGVAFGGHFILVTACAPGAGVLCHNGYGADVFMSWKRFHALWSASGRWMMFVCPPESVDWPLPPELKNELGRVLHRRKEWEKALLEYEAALKDATTGSARAVNAFNAGLAQFALGRLDEAQAAFRRALEHDPALAEAANALAYTHATRGVNLKEAEALARRAVATERKKLQEAEALARRVLTKLGRKPEDAQALVRRVLGAGKDKTALYLDTLGFVLHHRGRDDEALQVLREAREKADPDDRELLAEIYYHMSLASGSDPEAQETYLKKTIELAPESDFGSRARALLGKAKEKERKSR